MDTRSASPTCHRPEWASAVIWYPPISNVMQCFPPFADNISSKNSIYNKINKGFFIAMFGRRVAHATDAAGIFACDYLLVPLHHEDVGWTVGRSTLNPIGVGCFV